MKNVKLMELPCNEVSLLIGTDLVPAFAPFESYSHDLSSPSVLNTPFGQTIMGPTGSSISRSAWSALASVKEEASGDTFRLKVPPKSGGGGVTRKKQKVKNRHPKVTQVKMSPLPTPEDVTVGAPKEEIPHVQESSASRKIFRIFGSILSILGILFMVLLVNHLIMAMLLPVSPLPSTVQGHDHFKFIHAGQQLAYEQAAPANIGQDQEMAFLPSYLKVIKQNSSAQQDFVSRSIAGIRHGDVEDQWFQDTAVIEWHPLSQYSADDYGCHMRSPACQSPVMVVHGGPFEVPGAPLSKIKLRHFEVSRLSIGHFRDMCKIVSHTSEGGGVD